MASYWWECSNCGDQNDFPTVTQSRGITHYIWDVLIPSDWDQSYLIKACAKCGQESLRITYVFPRAEQTRLQVKHIVGLTPIDTYVNMMWETIPNGNIEETWIDFKYISGRNIFGLTRPAVFSKKEIGQVFELYKARTGDRNFPYS